MSGFALHRFIVYLPLGLTIGAFVCDLRGVIGANPGSHLVGSRLIRWATLAAAVAVASGFSLAGVAGLGSGGSVAGHAALALGGTLLLGVLGFLRYSAENREEDAADVGFPPAWLALETIAVLLMISAAGLGLVG